MTTFLNLAVDMAVGNDFDEDHGHLYGTQPLTAWRAMLAADGWTDDQSSNSGNGWPRSTADGGVWAVR
jgi:hypothetical protein